MDININFNVRGLEPVIASMERLTRVMETFTAPLEIDAARPVEVLPAPAPEKKEPKKKAEPKADKPKPEDKPKQEKPAENGESLTEEEQLAIRGKARDFMQQGDENKAAVRDWLKANSIERVTLMPRSLLPEFDKLIGA